MDIVTREWKNKRTETLVRKQVIALYSSEIIPLRMKELVHVITESTFLPFDNHIIGAQPKYGER